MSLRIYLKERVPFIFLLFFVLGSIETLGYLMMLPIGFLVYMGVCFAGVWLLIWTVDYLHRRTFYVQVKSHIQHLDQKYLLPELLECPEFQEGRIFYECLQELERSMLEHVGEFKRSSEEYKEYIELWVHEVKLPIAAGKMILENNKGPYCQSLEEELDRIDAYTEQALFYARSNYVEKDYLLNQVNLKEIAGEVIRKNKKVLLNGRFGIELENLDLTVYSDSKWLQFILEQILTNSIKYAGDTKKIRWSAKREKEYVKLVLEDFGVGISSKDISRVFEKGFTGNNGRTGVKSTGIGLYLCKKLCEKMGHRIILDAEEGQGCKVTIFFPKGSMTCFLEEQQRK